MNIDHLHFDIEDHGHLLVKRAVKRDDLIGETLRRLAMGDRMGWTGNQWNLVLDAMAVSQLKIKDWLLLDHPEHELNG